MADIQKLIETLLSDEKLTGSQKTSKVYQDEPILITAAQMNSYTPPKFRQMRKIAAGLGLYLNSDAKLFYEQAKFMEDFEDNFEYHGTFARYYPTYQAMNDIQLRGYFSWRTKLRQGDIRKTSLSFAFVYIYELLNRIGVQSTEEGFHTLKNFWTAYRALDPHIDSYVKLWLKDYVIYHKLDKSLLEGLIDEPSDDSVLVLLKHQDYSPDEVFSALNALSTYDLEKSKFFKQHPEDMKAVVYTVFSALSQRHKGDNPYENFFGRVYSNAYMMFHSAVFYAPEPPADFSYRINDIYSYRCKNGGWSCERFFCYGGKQQTIGELLRSIDFLMRQRYSFKSTLKAGKVNKAVQELILKEIDSCLEEQRKAALPKVEIDVSKLQGIRQTAKETQNKLIIEEEPAVEVLEEPQENATVLNDTEYTFMSCLLYGRPYEDLLKSKGLMLSVLNDSINEKLFELFSDTVLFEDGGKAELIEDYTDELKEIIRNQA